MANREEAVTSSLDYRPLLRYTRDRGYQPIDPKNHPLMPLWHVDESRLPQSRAGTDLRPRASEFLLWRREARGRMFRGHILARADVGSADRSGVAHLRTGTVPWVALATTANTQYIWLDHLVRHQIPGWFTIFGSDTWEVFEPPTPGDNQLLVFELHRRLL